MWGGCGRVGVGTQALGLAGSAPTDIPRGLLVSLSRWRESAGERVVLLSDHKSNRAESALPQKLPLSACWFACWASCLGANPRYAPPACLPISLPPNSAFPICWHPCC